MFFIIRRRLSNTHTHSVSALRAHLFAQADPSECVSFDVRFLLQIDLHKVAVCSFRVSVHINKQHLCTQQTNRQRCLIFQELKSYRALTDGALYGLLSLESSISPNRFS